MYEELEKIVKSYDCFGVVSHARPDGDAIGSTLAWGLALRAWGKKVRLWNADGVPERYSFLEGADLVECLPENSPDVPVLFCLDTGDWRRLGARAEAVLGKIPLVVNIDHHATNGAYGHVNVVEPGAAACGYVLFKILKSLGAEVTPAIASALYTAVNTDTGSFQYGSTTPDVMRAAAELMECGADVQKINRLVYQEIPWSVLMVNKEVLNHMVAEDGIAHYSMTLSRKKELELSLEDTKDLVDIVRVVKGAVAAAIFEELEEGRVRVSLRSKDPRLDVASVAARFGGGGHVMAAGIRMRGALEECRRRVLEEIRREIAQLG